MEYKLIKLEPDYSSAMPYLSFGSIPSYRISDVESSEEYDYQGFEYDSNALGKVCNHAAAMARRIERDNADANARSAIRRDYNNALKCLKIGKYGRRERIDKFTEYMLQQDWKTVIEGISALFEINGATSQDSLPDDRFIPDYGQLLVSHGDYALFIEDNYEKAVEEYLAATYEWRSKYNGRSEGYSLQIGSKHKIRSYVNLFSAIRDGSYLEGDNSFLSRQEREIVLLYNDIITKSNRHEVVVEDVEGMIALFEKCESNNHTRNLNQYVSHPMFNNDELNTLRLICVIVPRLFQLAFLDEVKILSEDAKKIQDSLKVYALNNLLYLKNSEFEWIPAVIYDYEEKHQWKILTSIARIQDDIKEIKKRLLIKDKIPELAYYTSWKTFSYMLPSDEENADNSNVGKLSVMHLSYMNDPMEGQVINEYLFGKQNKNGREQLAQPYVFIKCFTQSIDYLPMWKMYGDDAKGCCIVVDWNRTKQLNEEKEIALYKVCYLRRKKGDYFFVKSDNGNDKVLDDLGVLLEQLKKNVVELRKIEGKRLLSEILVDSIAYLFKDSSYCYEREARVLYSYSDYNKKIEHTRQSPPKLFVYTDYSVAIDEIILGPKFQDVYLWSPFIRSQIEKMNNINGYGQITNLSFSEINYR